MMNTAEMYKNNMFDFLDDGTDAESPEREGFVIDDDAKADWAVQKIKAELDEYDRLADLAENQIAAIKAKAENAKKKCEQAVSYFSSLLAQYFDTVEHKKAKTQESYTLLSGRLVKKYGGVEYKRDNDELLKYLKENAPDMIAVKESAKWADFKKRTQLTADGNVIDTETGEVLGCIQVVRKPDTFEVKF